MSKKKKRNIKRCENCYFYKKNIEENELPCSIGGIPESKTALANDKEYCDAFMWSDRFTKF